MASYIQGWEDYEIKTKLADGTELKTTGKRPCIDEDAIKTWDDAFAAIKEIAILVGGTDVPPSRIAGAFQSDTVETRWFGDAARNLLKEVKTTLTGEQINNAAKQRALASGRGKGGGFRITQETVFAALIGAVNSKMAGAHELQVESTKLVGISAIKPFEEKVRTFFSKLSGEQIKELAIAGNEHVAKLAKLAKK